MAKKTLSQFEEIKEKVGPYIELLMSKTNKADEAEELSNQFLVVSSYLADCLEILETRADGLKALETAIYSEAMARVPLDDKGKKQSVAAQEYEADRDAIYQGVLKDKASADAQVNWLTRHLKIFDHATTSFRQKADRLGRLR